MTDAELLEEERKKKEAAAMGEVQPQKPVTFRDYSVPESPRASGLSVFTPSGEVKPGVDVSAVTTAPETLPAPSEVNTALNQEVQVDSPGVDDSPSFVSKLGSFFNPSGASVGSPGLPPTFTPPSAGATQAEEGTDISPITLESLGLESPQQRILREGAQAATGASASQATPSVAPTVETPSGGAQGQVGASTPQGTFSTSPISIDPSVTAPISAEEFANLPVPEGTPAPVTIQGAEGTGYQKAPEGMVKAMSPDGTMVFATPDQANQMNADYAAENAANTQAQKDFLGSQAGRDFSNRMLRSVIDSPYSRESAAREARLEARPDFGDAVSDRDRRAARGEGISMADRTAMAKANARGASPSDIARGNKIADELGVDLKTGQPLQPAGGLTFEQQLAQDKFELEETKFIQSIVDNANAKTPLSPAQKKFAEEAGKGAYSWDQGGRQTSQENIGKFGQIIQDLEQGQLDTRTLSEFVPFGGDWWRSALNPTGQQGLDNVRGVIFQGLRDTLGAQFTEKEGERLVNAAYNPKLSEEQNIARLKPALARMKATFQAKEALTKHIMDGGDVRDYKGKTPMDVYKSFDGQAGSGSPIPGDVDVNIQDNAQAILDRQ